MLKLSLNGVCKEFIKNGVHATVYKCHNQYYKKRKKKRMKTGQVFGWEKDNW